MIPAKGVIARDLNLLNIGLAFDEAVSDCRARGRGKSLSTSHGRLAQQEEDDVLGYETENPLQIV